MTDAQTAGRTHGWPLGAASPVPMPGTIASVMSSSVITMDVGVSLEQALSRMRDADVHHLLLTDRGLVVALVSDRNLIRAMGVGPTSRDDASRYRRHPVFQVATYHLVTVEESASVEDGALLMLETGVSALPVVNETEHLVGILTSRDLLRYVADLGRVSAPAELRRASQSERPRYQPPHCLLASRKPKMRVRLGG